ncbi:MAG: hypothetical protein WCP14_03665 [bacterium]
MKINKFIENDKIKNFNKGIMSTQTIDLDISEIQEISYILFIWSPLWASEFKIIKKDGESGKILRVFPWNYGTIAKEIKRSNPKVIDKGFGFSL